MTAQRQETQAGRRRIAFIGLLANLVFAASIGPGAVSDPAMAATTERVVTDRYTGLAIGGFDPVAYFTEGKALFGRAEFELNLEGSVWRFNNEGNRGAFEKNPEVYAPQFGGYDPVAIGRGRSVQGHPLIWAVAGQRLYLFYSEQTRASFLADPGRIFDTAERKWPDVRNLGQ